MWDAITSPLMGALGAVGNVLSAPRNLMWQGINALTGRQDTGVGDVLKSLGVADPVADVGGFVGDVATDPLTWAGLGAGRLLRGFGSAAPELGTASRAGSVAALKSPLGQVAEFQGLHRTADPLAMFGPASSAGILDDAAGAGRVAASAMDRSANRLVGEVRRGPAVNLSADDLAAGVTRREIQDDLLTGRINQMSRSDPVLNSMADQAFYDPTSRSIAFMEQAPGQAVRRHERTHAIIDQASQNPDLAKNLPFFMRQAAGLKSGGQLGQFRHDVGAVMDEALAHASEARNLGGQLQGAAHFLFDPKRNADYRRIYQQAGLNPWVTVGFGALPYSGEIAGAGAAAAGRGSSSLYDLLTGGSSR